MEFYSVQDIANILKMDPVTIRKYLKQGKMKGIKIGRDYRVKKENFLNFLNEIEEHPEILQKKANNNLAQIKS